MAYEVYGTLQYNDKMGLTDHLNMEQNSRLVENILTGPDGAMAKSLALD